MKNQCKIEAGVLQNRGKWRSGGLPEECWAHFWCLERSDALGGPSCDEKVASMTPT